MQTKYIITPSYTSPFNLYSNDNVYTSSYQNDYEYESYDSPKANIYREGDEGYTIELAVPGYSREDFSIDTDFGAIIVSASITSNKENNKLRSPSQKEWSNSDFKTAFALPDHVNIDQINASYIAGVLLINMPVNKDKNTKSRKIDID